MIQYWEGSYCTRIDGLFSKNCYEQSSEGKDSWTTCNQNTYATGIKRGHNDGIDASSLRCCEIDYNEPLTGNDPLPTSYRNDQGLYSFKHENGQWISSQRVNNLEVRSSNYGKLETFTVVNYGPDLGLYKIRTSFGQYIKCKENEDKPLMRHETWPGD